MSSYVVSRASKDGNEAPIIKQNLKNNQQINGTCISTCVIPKIFVCLFLNPITSVTKSLFNQAVLRLKYFIRETWEQETK